MARYRDYVETLVQRDVRDLARIGTLDALPRLLAAAAARTARLLNVSELASPFQVSRPTIRDYMTLLERIFQVTFYHFRDKDGVEVDIVLARGREIAGVEVKAAATLTDADFRGLRKLKDAAGGHFAAGMVLYDGESCADFGDKLYAVPVRVLRETAGVR